jgi:hypothetical protein
LSTKKTIWLLESVATKGIESVMSADNTEAVPFPLVELLSFLQADNKTTTEPARSSNFFTFFS